MDLGKNAEGGFSVYQAINSNLHSLLTNFLFPACRCRGEKNKIMPVATISSTVWVQEQTFQAFLNWLSTAPDFLWHSSPGRNAAGNLLTLPEVSPRGAERRLELNIEVNIWDSFPPKENIYPEKEEKGKIPHSVTPSLDEWRGVLLFLDGKSKVKDWSRTANSRIFA